MLSKENPKMDNRSLLDSMVDSIRIVSESGRAFVFSDGGQMHRAYGRKIYRWPEQSGPCEFSKRSIHIKALHGRANAECHQHSLDQ